MNNKDLDDAAGLLHISIEESHKNIAPYDPAIEVEKSLSHFLQHRLAKLQEDASKEEAVWDAIFSRVQEFNPDQLMRLLNILQENNNTGVEKVLSPFIPRAGDKVPLLPDASRKTREIPEETIFNESNKDLIAAFEELNKLVRNLSAPKLTEDPEAIKKALK